jgi:hypothetical protein
MDIDQHRRSLLVNVGYGNLARLPQFEANEYERSDEPGKTKNL